MNKQKTFVKQYTQGSPSLVILRSSRNQNITVTVKVIQDLVTPTSPIYHELIILGLENACQIYRGACLEPAFFPILKTNGWSEVMNWFSDGSISGVSQPNYQHHNISLPVHVHGNHWVAVCRQRVSGGTYFYYADDLNSKATENMVKHHLFDLAPPDFRPASSMWVTCQNTTYRPHSNECEPRTMLVLTVMMSHPRPHAKMLAPYMNSNLAIQARVWMASCLLSGTSLLLSPALETATNRCVIHLLAPSTPFQVINWSTQTNCPTLEMTPLLGRPSYETGSYHGKSPIINPARAQKTNPRTILKTNQRMHTTERKVPPQHTISSTWIFQ
jgi:hypothetical protein